MEDSELIDHDLPEPHKGEDAVEVPPCAFPEKIEPDSSSPVDETLDRSDFVSALASDPNSKRGDTTDLLCKDLHENEQITFDTHVLERNIASSDEKHELNDNHIRPDDNGDGPDGRMAVSVIGKSAVLSFLDEKGCSDSDEKMVDAMSEDKGWTSTSGLLSLNDSDNSENEDCAEYPLPESSYISFGNMFPNSMHIVIIPDYVIYGGTLYTESQVTFSVESIKIDCSDPIGLEDKLVAEWMHSDVNSLGCKRSASVDAALVELCVRANGMIKTKKHQGDPENIKIIFSATEANWTETEQRIMNLTERYMKLWASYPSDGMVWDDDDIYSNIDFSGGYLSNIAPPFEEVIYPKGDPDAVSISRRDVELLQPEIFINDTIIDFYIKYLKNKIPLNKKQRFHFFNSFFFRKLADLDKERGSVSEGRSAFLRVRKWTRKVNIFEKDYIFIPVNFNLHWSLLVICHPGEAAKMKDGNVEDFPKLPCVLHMDSLKGTHSGLKSIIQSYIWEEWKERHPESLENGSTNFSSLRFVPLELPQQDNLFDCGLFLLHYVELFLEEAPLELNPLKISRFGTFLTADWFQPSEASLKRSVIWNLIYKLINDPDEQAMAPPCNNDCASQATAEHNDGQGTTVRHSASPKQVPDDANFCEVVKYDLQTEVVLQEFQRAPTVPSPCNNSPEHCDRQGAIVELFEGHTASPKQVTDNDDFSEVVNYDAQPEVVLQEFLEQGAPVIPFPQHLEHANHYNALHPAFTPPYCVLMDDACTSEQLALTNIGSEYNLYLDGQLNVEPCTTSLSHMEVGPHERSVNPTEESAEQNLLHDYLNLKDIDFREDESLVAADNSGFVTDFVVSICQKKHNGRTKKFQEKDETKSEEGDSGGCPRVNADEEDEEDHHKSCQIAESVDSVNEDKDVPVVDTVMLVGSTDHNNMTETLSEHCQEDCITKTVALEHGCQQMSVDDGKTEDRDGQKNPFQIASPDKFQENDETKSQKGDTGGGPRVHADGKDEEDQISCEIAGDFGGSPKVHADKEDEEDRHKSCQIAESVDAVSEDKDVPMGDTVIQVGSTDRNNMTEAISEHFKEDHSTKVITEEHDCQQMSVDEGKTEDCDGQKNPSKIASPDKFQENDEIKSVEGDSGVCPKVANEEDEEDHQISCKIARDSTGCSVGNADKEDEEDHDKICQIAESVNAASEDKNIPMADTVIQVGSIDRNYMTHTISEHCQEDCSTEAVAKEQDCLQMSVDEGRTGDCDGQKNPSQIASTDEFTAGDASSHDGVQMMDTVYRKLNKKRKLHAVPSMRHTRSRARMLDP